MIENNWNIINLPYSIINNEEYNLSFLDKNQNDICPVCLEKCFNEKDKIACIHENLWDTPYKFYTLHHMCLIEYIKHQIIEDDNNCFKCPYRYNIDFNNCKKLIDYKYYYL